jgi:predicted RNase H-like nuclease (RuvC/YqgF family)
MPKRQKPLDPLKQEIVGLKDTITAQARIIGQLKASGFDPVTKELRTELKDEKQKNNDLTTKVESLQRELQIVKKDRDKAREDLQSYKARVISALKNGGL